MDSLDFYTFRFDRVYNFVLRIIGQPQPLANPGRNFLKKGYPWKHLRGTLRFETENRFVLILTRFVLRASHVSFCGLYFSIEGPERAGADILLSSIFTDYPNASRPVDFLIRNDNGEVCAIGLARYDSDRGGAQEDDRIGGYMNCAKEILEYSNNSGKNLKVIFANDGPGLLLGSMWDDYAKLENISSQYIKVVTLRMVKDRINVNWLNQE